MRLLCNNRVESTLTLTISVYNWSDPSIGEENIEIGTYSKLCCSFGMACGCIHMPSFVQRVGMPRFGSVRFRGQFLRTPTLNPVRFKPSHRTSNLFGVRSGLGPVWVQ